jgi:hypothetical protein
LSNLHNLRKGCPDVKKTDKNPPADEIDETDLKEIFIYEAEIRGVLIS